MRALLLILGILWASNGQASELMVIVSTQVPDDSISAEQLANIYTLKKNFWADKTMIVPVNREASSAEREKFSEAVFHLSSRELAEYLDRLRFLGKLPPVVQTSDEAVISFVRKVPGAIGYISANKVPSGLKILMRLP
jgi:ABC-type phosphate transport system substrate-binding protein